MMATVGTSSVVEPLDAKKRWVFKTTQNDDLIAAALIGHMRRNGMKSVGLIGFNDPYGENWFKVFGGLADKAGIAITGTERYRRTDQSVTGQVLKLVAAKPDAVLIAAVGGPAVLPQATFATRATREGSTRRTPWPPTISSSSAVKRSKARYWPPVRCW